MTKTKDEILWRLCDIEVELSDIHIANKTGSFDMDRSRRRNLSEEHVMLTREYNRLDTKPQEADNEND